MAYQKGDLRINESCKQLEEEGYCDHSPEHERVIDGRHDCPGGRVAYLPHSCDHWVIGGPEEVRAMIQDLRVALQKIEAS